MSSTIYAVDDRDWLQTTPRLAESEVNKVTRKYVWIDGNSSAFRYRARLPLDDVHWDKVSCLEDYIGATRRRIETAKKQLEQHQQNLAWAEKMLRLERATPTGDE